MTVLSDDGTVVVAVGGPAFLVRSVVMPAVEERVAYVEGQVGEHSSLIVEMRQTMHHFEQRMDARFDGMERRFESMDSRIDRLDHRVSQNFTWVVGIQITTLIAIVGALLART